MDPRVKKRKFLGSRSEKDNKQSEKLGPTLLTQLYERTHEEKELCKIIIGSPTVSIESRTSNVRLKYEAVTSTPAEDELISISQIDPVSYRYESGASKAKKKPNVPLEAAPSKVESWLNQSNFTEFDNIDLIDSSFGDVRKSHNSSHRKLDFEAIKRGETADEGLKEDPYEFVSSQRERNVTKKRKKVAGIRRSYAKRDIAQFFRQKARNDAALPKTSGMKAGLTFKKSSFGSSEKIKDAPTCAKTGSKSSEHTNKVLTCEKSTSKASENSRKALTCKNSNSRPSENIKRFLTCDESGSKGSNIGETCKKSHSGPSDISKKVLSDKKSATEVSQVDKTVLPVTQTSGFIIDDLDAFDRLFSEKPVRQCKTVPTALPSDTDSEFDNVLPFRSPSSNRGRKRGKSRFPKWSDDFSWRGNVSKKPKRGGTSEVDEHFQDRDIGCGGVLIRRYNLRKRPNVKKKAKVSIVKSVPSKKDVARVEVPNEAEDNSEQDEDSLSVESDGASSHISQISTTSYHTEQHDMHFIDVDNVSSSEVSEEMVMNPLADLSPTIKREMLRNLGTTEEPLEMNDTQDRTVFGDETIDYPNLSFNEFDKELPLHLNTSRSSCGKEVSDVENTNAAVASLPHNSSPLRDEPATEKVSRLLTERRHGSCQTEPFLGDCVECPSCRTVFTRDENGVAKIKEEKIDTNVDFEKVRGFFLKLFGCDRSNFLEVIGSMNSIMDAFCNNVSNEVSLVGQHDALLVTKTNNVAKHCEMPVATASDTAKHCDVPFTTTNDVSKLCEMSISTTNKVAKRCETPVATTNEVAKHCELPIVTINELNGHSVEVSHSVVENKSRCPESAVSQCCSNPSCDEVDPSLKNGGSMNGCELSSEEDSFSALVESEHSDSLFSLSAVDCEVEIASLENGSVDCEISLKSSERFELAKPVATITSIETEPKVKKTTRGLALLPVISDLPDNGGSSQTPMSISDGSDRARRSLFPRPQSYCRNTVSREPPDEIHLESTTRLKVRGEQIVTMDSSKISDPPEAVRECCDAANESYEKREILKTQEEMLQGFENCSRETDTLVLEPSQSCLEESPRRRSEGNVPSNGFEYYKTTNLILDGANDAAADDDDDDNDNNENRSNKSQSQSQWCPHSDFSTETEFLNTQDRNKLMLEINAEKQNLLLLEKQIKMEEKGETPTTSKVSIDDRNCVSDGDEDETRNSRLRKEDEPSSSLPRSKNVSAVVCGRLNEVRRVTTPRLTVRLTRLTDYGSSDSLPASKRLEKSGSFKDLTGMLFVVSTLTSEEKLTVERFVKLFNGKMSNTVTRETTDVIVKTDSECRCQRTIKYLMGVANHCFIIGYDWIEDCLEQKCLLEKDRYEVIGDTTSVAVNGPKNSRSSSSPLLSGYELYCPITFSDVNDEDWLNLVDFCGGTVVTHPSSFSSSPKRKAMIIVQDPDTFMSSYTRFKRLHETCKVNVVNRDWILSSISSYKIQPVISYLLLKA